MANVAFQDAISVADIAALKAIAQDERAENSLRVVVNPDNDLPPTWYQFRIDSTFYELSGLFDLSPAIVTPDAGSGCWIMVGMPVYFGSNVPDLAPPLTGMRWIFGTRIWESVGTSMAADWIELTTKGITVAYDPFGEGEDEYSNVAKIIFKAGNIVDLGNGTISYKPVVTVNDSYYFASRINFEGSQFITNFSNGVIYISLA